MKILIFLTALFSLQSIAFWFRFDPNEIHSVKEIIEQKIPEFYDWEGLEQIRILSFDNSEKPCFEKECILLEDFNEKLELKIKL